MTTPDWPERKRALVPAPTYGPDIVYHNAYVLELERRYAILHRAVLERSQAPARGINCIELLAQCPPLPKEKERE